MTQHKIIDFFKFQVPPEPAIRQHLHSAPSTGRLGAATATSSSMFCCSGEVDNGADCDKSTFLPLTSSADDGKQLLPIQVRTGYYNVVNNTFHITLNLVVVKRCPCMLPHVGFRYDLD